MQIYRWLMALTIPLLVSASSAMAQTANPPTNVIPTYTIDTSDVNNHTINGVSIRWAPGAAATDGWTVSGYNLFRAPAATGPWTKLNTTPIAATEPRGYLDGAPTDPASTFYALTAIETNGFDTRESAQSEPAQAANNLVFNSSFERDWWGSGDPVGWTFGKWSGDGTGKITPDQKVEGNNGVFIKTGATGRGASFFDTEQRHFPPTAKDVPYVLGMYGRFEDTQTTWPLALRQAWGKEDKAWNCRPFVVDWYPVPEGKTLSDWDSAGLVANGDTDWTWLANTAGAVPHPDATTTRLGVFWANDGLTTLGVSTAFADDVRFQRKTIGATGDIWGVIQQSGANPVSARVTAAGKTVWTDPYQGRFVLRDMPTGPVEMTISAGGETDRKITVPNYGGFVYFGHESVGYITLWDEGGLPLRLEGHVTLPDGSPAVDAEVSLYNPDWGVMNAWTDAQGYYSFTNVGSWSFSDIIVKKDPYPAIALNTAFGLNGLNIRDFQFASGPPQRPKFEIAKANTPPVIDGTVNLATEWAASQPISLSGPDGAPPTVKTTAYALWDANNLYLAFVSEEPNPDGIEARATGEDNQMIYTYDNGATWNADDIIGVWLDPTKAQLRFPGTEQWQILTNTNQTNPSWADIKWSPWNMADSDIAGFQFKARVDAPAKAWYTEMKIPYAGLAVPGGMDAPVVTAGTEWLIELQRARHQPLPDGEGFSTDWALATFVNAISPFPKGDLNGDRQVTEADAMVAARIIGGLEALGTRLPQGDIDGDNKVTVIDASRIMRKTQGLDNF